MASITTRPTNGVSYGYKHTVTATDASDGYVEIDFQVDYAIAATIQVITTAGVIVDISDAVITYPANGKVRIADGAATYTTTATDVIIVVAQRDNA